MPNTYTAKQNKQVALFVKYKKKTESYIYIYIYIHTHTYIRGIFEK